MTRIPRSLSRTAAAKGVPFSASPVLAVKLPAWRSRVVLFSLFVAFCALTGRALWLQGISTEFLQKQGESRYARTLELPATRGKITDRTMRWMNHVAGIAIGAFGLVNVLLSRGHRH